MDIVIKPLRDELYLVSWQSRESTGRVEPSVTQAYTQRSQRVTLLLYGLAHVQRHNWLGISAWRLGYVLQAHATRLVALGGSGPW